MTNRAPPEPGTPACGTVWLVILGIGTDLIEIARIAHSIDRFGDSFLRRVYTPEEIAYCRARNKTSAQSFAARFAAKEAAAKALGTGIARGVAWTEFAVTRLPGQRPTLQFHGRAAELAARLGVTRTHLSLTHARDQAIAIVLLES